MRKLIFLPLATLLFIFNAVYGINALLCKLRFHNVCDLWLLCTLTGRNEMFLYFVNWMEKQSCLYPPCGNMVIYFSVSSTRLPLCFLNRNERSCFRHVSFIIFPFLLVSVMFLLTYLRSFLNPYNQISSVSGILRI